MSCERKNSNDEFLETNKTNTRLSIDYNKEVYSQETVMNLIYLPYWKGLNIEDSLQCIVWIFENLLEELELDSYLDYIYFIPKEGYEDDDETMKNLQKTKGILLPKFNIIIDDIAVDIIKYCQTLIELSYQFSKGNINEIVYNTKSIEIYNTIKGLIDDKSHIKLFFNPNDVLCKNE